MCTLHVFILMSCTISIQVFKFYVFSIAVNLSLFLWNWKLCLQFARDVACYACNISQFHCSIIVWNIGWILILAEYIHVWPFVYCNKGHYFCVSQVFLRRMVYLAIKEMADLAEDVIIVTSSLTKDMTGKEDMYRASAIRTLCKITDVSYLYG